jgi:hypothetical protein
MKAFCPIVIAALLCSTCSAAFAQHFGEHYKPLGDSMRAEAAAEAAKEGAKVIAKSQDASTQNLTIAIVLGAGIIGGCILLRGHLDRNRDRRPRAD